MFLSLSLPLLYINTTCQSRLCRQERQTASSKGCFYMISASKLVFLNLSKHTPNNINTTKSKTLSGFFRNIMSVTDQTMDFQQPRLVAKKILAKPQSEGEGAVVRRSIGRYPNYPFLHNFLFSSSRLSIGPFFLGKKIDSLVFNA